MPKSQPELLDCSSLFKGQENIARVVTLYEYYPRHHWGCPRASTDGAPWAVMGAPRRPPHSSAHAFSHPNLKTDFEKILTSAAVKPCLRINCTSYVYSVFLICSCVESPSCLLSVNGGGSREPVGSPRGPVLSRRAHPCWGKHGVPRSQGARQGDPERWSKRKPNFNIIVFLASGI